MTKPRPKRTTKPPDRLGFCAVTEKPQDPAPPRRFGISEHKEESDNPFDCETEETDHGAESLGVPDPRPPSPPPPKGDTITTMAATVAFAKSNTQKSDNGDPEDLQMAESEQGTSSQVSGVKRSGDSSLGGAASRPRGMTGVAAMKAATAPGEKTKPTADPPSRKPSSPGPSKEDSKLPAKPSPTDPKTADPAPTNRNVKPDPPAGPNPPVPALLTNTNPSPAVASINPAPADLTGQSIAKVNPPVNTDPPTVPTPPVASSVTGQSSASAQANLEYAEKVASKSIWYLKLGSNPLTPNSYAVDFDNGVMMLEDASKVKFPQWLADVCGSEKDQKPLIGRPHLQEKKFRERVTSMTSIRASIGDGTSQLTIHKYKLSDGARASTVIEDLKKMGLDANAQLVEDLIELASDYRKAL